MLNPKNDNFLETLKAELLLTKTEGRATIIVGTIRNLFENVESPIIEMSYEKLVSVLVNAVAQRYQDKDSIPSEAIGTWIGQVKESFALFFDSDSTDDEDERLSPAKDLAVKDITPHLRKPITVKRKIVSNRSRPSKQKEVIPAKINSTPDFDLIKALKAVSAAGLKGEIDLKSGRMILT